MSQIAASHRARSMIDSVVVEMSETLDDSSSYVTNAIHESVGCLEDDLYVATRQSTRANLGLVTTMITEGSGPTDFSAPQEALSYARDYVHNGLSLEALTTAYRVGERAYTRLWLERLQARADDPKDLADAMGFFSDWLFAYITAINDPLSKTYAAEQERWISDAVAMRSEEVRAIIAGADVDVTEAGARLRYRLDGKHVAFVLWSGSPEGDNVPSREISQLAGEVAACLGATSWLGLPMGRYYAGWAAVRGEPDPAELPAGRHGLRIAIGRLGMGLEGFRRSHQEALLARRVATLSAQETESCTSFESTALDALLTRDLDEGRQFVSHELGPLLDGSDGNRRLLATLEVFLDEGSSFVGTARRLGVHQNTVSYRVHRAEDLLGRKVAERPFEMRMALRLAHFVSGEPEGGAILTG